MRETPSVGKTISQVIQQDRCRCFGRIAQVGEEACYISLAEIGFNHVRPVNVEQCTLGALIENAKIKSLVVVLLVITGHAGFVLFFCTCAV